jgi:hypothetical protein
MASSIIRSWCTRCCGRISFTWAPYWDEENREYRRACLQSHGCTSPGVAACSGAMGLCSNLCSRLVPSGHSHANIIKARPSLAYGRRNCTVRARGDIGWLGLADLLQSADHESPRPNVDAISHLGAVQDHPQSYVCRSNIGIPWRGRDAPPIVAPSPSAFDNHLLEFGRNPGRRSSVVQGFRRRLRAVSDASPSLAIISQPDKSRSSLCLHFSKRACQMQVQLSVMPPYSGTRPRSPREERNKRAQDVANRGQ